MTKFKNNYLIMRHGESEANVLKKVVSDPAIGCKQFGLTAFGQQQISASILAYEGKAPTKIYCSDFKRTQETAKLAAELFSLASVNNDVRLRERYFGDYEGKTAYAYELAWASDLLSDTETEFNVESSHQVCQRMLEMILALENQYNNETILLVSHGDPLQILSTAFHSIPSNFHRNIPHHETAEIKLLASLGDPIPELAAIDELIDELND